jgi:hypothetical protein
VVPDPLQAEAEYTTPSGEPVAAMTPGWAKPELSIVTEKMTALLTSITASTSRGLAGHTGRVRHALRVAGSALEREFE